jgi:pteridine reductase
VPVAVHYRLSGDAAREIAGRARAAGVDAIALDADLSDAAAVSALIDRARDALGTIAYLVNNASAFEPGGALETDLQTWQRHQTVNVTAPFLLSKTMAERLGDGEGAIVNVLDWRALRPGPDYFAYTVSKAALAAMTRSLAQALGPAIRVNGVALGPILPPPGPDPVPERVIARTVAKRKGGLDEVVRAVCFLLRDATYTTGEILHVDGGRHLT